MAVGSFVRRLYVPSRRVIFEVRALRKGVWILSPALVPTPPLLLPHPRSCALPPRTDGKEVAEIMGNITGSTGDWASEARASYSPRAPSPRTLSFRPVGLRPNLLSDDPARQLQSTSREAHAHPGNPPRARPKGPVRGNDPSDPKDPFLGLLMDPDRLKRLHGTFGTSGYQDCFIAPPRTAYSPRENPQAGGYKPFEHNPPYDNDRTPRLVSEQRAQYGWPTFYVQEPNMKYRYKSEIGPIMNPPGAQTGF